MPIVQLNPNQCVLLVVDLQTSLAPHLFESERVVDRSAFLVKIARLLGVPILVTEQNPSRMGATVVELEVPENAPYVYAKMAFGIGGCPEIMSALATLGRRQVVVIGVETHICVGQSVMALLGAGYETVVCPDATGARSNDRHRLGMERIRDAGAVPMHTEAVAYEWLGSALHPRFREALTIVKARP